MRQSQMGAQPNASNIHLHDPSVQPPQPLAQLKDDDGQLNDDNGQLNAPPLPDPLLHFVEERE